MSFPVRDRTVYNIHLVRGTSLVQLPVEHTPDDFRRPQPALQDVCIICGERMEDAQPCPVVKCKHIFHKSCLQNK